MTAYYQDEAVTIYHGDCIGLLAEIEADVMVTDPPYGVSYSSGWQNEFRGVTVANDTDLSAREEVLRRWGNKPALVFGSWKRPKPSNTKLVLTWDKGTVGMGDVMMPWFPCTEEIYVLGDGWNGSRTSAVLRVVGRNTWHPTEKPEALMRALLLKCPAGVIVDPFMGSGSTLVAAKNIGRKAIGVEIEERYCECAVKRLAQGVLFQDEASA